MTPRIWEYCQNSGTPAQPDQQKSKENYIAGWSKKDTKTSKQVSDYLNAKPVCIHQWEYDEHNDIWRCLCGAFKR